MASLTRQQTQHALWELATAGLAAADGFDQLRACMDSRRRSTTTETPNKRSTRSSAGRWSLLNDADPTTKPGNSNPAVMHATNPGTEGRVATSGTNSGAPEPALGPSKGLDPETWVGPPLSSTQTQNAQLTQQAIEQARRTDAALESFARQLLARYGILFRDLLTRESNAPRWRDLLNILRRLEARGEIRGGRFLSGFAGEQYALPEAVESLRAARTRDCSAIIPVSAADPMNLAGIVIPGDRVPSVPGKQILYRNGTLYSESTPDNLSAGEITLTLPPTVLPAAAPPTLRLF
jgi:ATP-dependent Lhr-like helicase